MKNRTRLLALLVSVAVNACALAAAHEAMAQFTRHEQLALAGPGKAVAQVYRPANTVLAKRNCPQARVL
jgi:hypothetical protein